MKIVNAAPIRYASGQLGKSRVWFRWRGQQVNRAYVVPTNPSTMNQQVIRGNVAALSVAFRGLSSSQVEAWKAYARTRGKRNALGQEVFPTALGAFIGLNSVNLLRGGLQVNNPPSVRPPAAPMAFELAALVDLETLSVVVYHNHSSVEGKWLQAKYLPTPSLNYTPDWRKMRLICGATGESFLALPPSGGTAFFYPIYAWMNPGTPFMCALRIVDEWGQYSPWVQQMLVQSEP